MHKPAPLYAEAAKHAPAHIQRWQNEGWGLSPGLLKTTSVLVGLLLLGLLCALSGCTTANTAHHSTTAEHAAPTAATR
jgi:hypothetical protein